MELGSWVKDGDPTDPDHGKSLSLSSCYLTSEIVQGDQAPPPHSVLPWF